MSIKDSATTTTEIEDVFASVLRDTVYGGKDLVLIEPYDGPRPREAYATIHLVSAQGHDHEITEEEPVGFGSIEEVIGGESWCRVIVQFFGGDAFKTAIAARNRMKSSNRLFDLLRHFGMGTIGEAQDFSGPHWGKYENRARFTVDFYALLAGEDVVASVRQVQGSINSEVPFNVRRKRKTRK